MQKTRLTRPAFGQAQKRIRNQRQRTRMKGHVISLQVKILSLLQRCVFPSTNKVPLVCIGYVTACTLRADMQRYVTVVASKNSKDKNGIRFVFHSHSLLIITIGKKTTVI